MPIGRTLGTWLLLAVLMPVNGVLREFVLVPAMGRPAAEAASVALGIAIILVTTWLAFRALALPPGTRAAMGLLLVALTVAFEFLFFHYVRGVPWPELTSQYAFWRGETWPLILLAIGVSPLLWARDRQAPPG